MFQRSKVNSSTEVFWSGVLPVNDGGDAFSSANGKDEIRKSKYEVTGFNALVGMTTTDGKAGASSALQKGLLVDGGEGFVGGAEKRGGFVEDDANGDVAEEAFKFPLVLEGVKESAVFHFFEDLDGDAAGDVNRSKDPRYPSRRGRTCPSRGG